MLPYVDVGVDMHFFVFTTLIYEYQHQIEMYSVLDLMVTLW